MTRATLPLLAGVLVAACGESRVTAPPAGDATIDISIVGLPAGAPAGVTVSGTGGGANRTVAATAVIDVVPGTYTISAAPVMVAGTSWYPNLTSEMLTVGFGQTWTGKIRYGRLPVAGAHSSTLDLFDSAMVAYMSARNIGAGTLTVSRNGEVVYSRAFGWRDSARTEILSPRALMRLASNSKPITSAAIRTLVSQGLLSLDTRAFPFLGLTPAGTVTDARINDITVQHLLEHTAGWNRSVAGDIMFKSRDISRALGITAPPTKTQIAQFVMTQPLQQQPGTATSYSNFGYLVLGLIIEKVTGQPFVDYVRQNVFSQSVAGEVIEGRSLRPNRDAREPFYADPYKGCSVFVIDVCVLVPWPDGGWYIESFDSCGGLVASAPAMASFLERYWITGQPREPGTSASFIFYGSLDGTFTLTRQRSDGSTFVALFNQRTDPSGLKYEDIAQILDAAADRVLVTSSPSWRSAVP